MRVFHRLGANHHVGPLAVWLTAPASKAEADARAHLGRGNGSNIATRLVVQGHERVRQEAIALEAAPEDRKDNALGLFVIAQRDIRIIPKAVLVAFSDGRDAQAAVQAGGFNVDGRCYSVYKMPPPSDYIWNTRQRSPATVVLTGLALGLVLFLGLFVARDVFTGMAAAQANQVCPGGSCADTWALPELAEAIVFGGGAILPYLLYFRAAPVAIAVAVSHLAHWIDTPRRGWCVSTLRCIWFYLTIVLPYSGEASSWARLTALLRGDVSNLVAWACGLPGLGMLVNQLQFLTIHAIVYPTLALLRVDGWWGGILTLCGRRRVGAVEGQEGLIALNVPTTYGAVAMALMLALYAFGPLSILLSAMGTIGAFTLQASMAHKVLRSCRQPYEDYGAGTVQGLRQEHYAQALGALLLAAAMPSLGGGPEHVASMVLAFALAIIVHIYYVAPREARMLQLPTQLALERLANPQPGDPPPRYCC